MGIMVIVIDEYRGISGLILKMFLNKLLEILRMNMIQTKIKMIFLQLKIMKEVLVGKLKN